MIPFTGTAPVLNAMLGGQVDYECDPVLGTLSQVQAGNVKALAIAAKKRSPLLPDVPTSHEQGLPEFDIAPFYAVFVPSGTPQAVIDKLCGRPQQGAQRGGRSEAVGRSRRRYRGAGAPRTKSPRGSGQKRNRTADARFYEPRRRNDHGKSTAPRMHSLRRDQIDTASAPTQNLRERARRPKAARRGARRCPPVAGSGPDKAS